MLVDVLHTPCAPLLIAPLLIAPLLIAPLLIAPLLIAPLLIAPLLIADHCVAVAVDLKRAEPSRSHFRKSQSRQLLTTHNDSYERQASFLHS